MDYSAKEGLVELFFEKVKGAILPSEGNNYKSRFLQSNALLYCVVLVLSLKIIATLVSVNFPQNIFFADITKSVLENSVNLTRQSLGLKPLVENQKLNQAARLKAENMVQNQYFNHTSPTGVTPWFWFLKAGYNYKYAGENLAIGFYDSKEVYDAWLNSPAHKANILNPKYTEVGTAVLGGFGQNNTIIVVQEFASPLPVKQAPIKNNNTSQAKAQPKISPSVKNPEPNVLSQSTEMQSVPESLSKTSGNDLSSKIVNYALYNYNDILQDVVYGISLVVIGIMLALIFFSFNTIFRKELVFRAVLIIVLLSAATLLNRDILISLIPHQIII